MKVIGLTGVPSVGKGCVKEFLFAWLRRRGMRAAYMSFSDEIKAEARARGLGEEQFERERLRAIVTDMRRREGPGVLARRLADRIRTTPDDERPDVFLVEALRHPEEVRCMRDAFGDDFRLLAVTADLERVAAWMAARRRPDESRVALRSREDALALLRRELRGDDDLSVNVAECIRQADAEIENAGTLEDLKRRTEETAAVLLGR